MEGDAEKSSSVHFVVGKILIKMQSLFINSKIDITEIMTLSDFFNAKKVPDDRFYNRENF